MKVRPVSSWPKGEPVDVATYVKRELDVADYDQGALEDLEATVTNLLNSFGILLEVLADKGVLRVDNVERIIDKYTLIEEVEE